MRLPSRREKRISAGFANVGVGLDAGLVFSSALPVQAATNVYCEHAHYMIVYNAKNVRLNKTDGHYDEIGTKHVCAGCGHVYWTDLHEVFVSGHSWVDKFIGTDKNGDPVYRKICSDSECNKYK